MGGGGIRQTYDASQRYYVIEKKADASVHEKGGGATLDKQIKKPRW